MNKNAIIFIGLLILTIIIGIISNTFYTNNTLKEIEKKAIIKKIDIDLITGGNPNISTHTEITDSLLLNKITSLLVLDNDIIPDRPNIHSEFMNIYVYKSGEKINLQILKTDYSGWVIVVGDKYFKNDFLVNLLRNQ